MLLLIDRLHKLHFSALMAVYDETNRKSGGLSHPEFSEGQQLCQAEQAFYQYLSECFFPTPGAVYAIWEKNGEYISALRLEPYQDGLLLEALETAPAHRRKGYGEKLVQAVLAHFPGKIYSHVSRQNAPSLALHQKCGFVRIADYAKYIDGSISHTAVTLCRG